MPSPVLFAVFRGVLVLWLISSDKCAVTEDGVSKGREAQNLLSQACTSQPKPTTGYIFYPSFPCLIYFLNFILFIFYAAGSYYLSILYILVYICQSQSPNSSHHHRPCHFHPLLSIRLFSTSVSQFLPCKLVHLYHFSRFHIYALIYDIFVFLFLTSICMTVSRSIHVSTNDSISFLLWLGNIPLYICTTSSLSIHLSMGI